VATGRRADQYEPLPGALAERWSKFAQWDRPYFPTHVGLRIEEIRTDYCRMRMPFRPELEQAGGVVHGGAIATVLDTVVVPAIGSSLPENARFSTVDLHVQYLSALIGEDAVAEGWVVKRGRTTVFCESELRTDTGKLIARGILTYNVSLGNVTARADG
jgi:uncharacterized protein (TIGR00369 family)